MNHANRNQKDKEYRFAGIPESVKLGAGVRIKAEQLNIGEGVAIGDGTIIAGDRVTIGDGTIIAEGTDIRASEVQIGSHTEIGRNVKILVAERFCVGNATRISRAVEITCRGFEAGELLFLGHELAVGYGGTTESTAVVSLGNRVALGPHNILNANCLIRLDDQVGSGSHLAMWTHGYHFGHSILDGFSAVFQPIHVKQNAWLGFHVTVLPGVTIGENTIVAAGSVVNKDLPDNCLAAGVPAKVKQTLNQAALSPEESDQVVRNLLQKWCGELNWKGWHIELLSEQNELLETFKVITPDSSDPTSVTFLAHNTPEPEYLEGTSYCRCLHGLFPCC